jgi:putative nucleotidyltransferase with HDIG domain
MELTGLLDCLGGEPVRFFRRFINVTARVTQAFLPRFAEPDDVFAKNCLPTPEYLLYKQMDVRDRDHACQVTKTLLSLHPEASRELVCAALLHDVGKSDSSYHPIHRIIVHLFTPKHMPANPRYQGLKGAWQRNLYHSHYGAELIRSNGGNARVADLVEKHHNPQSDSEAELLRQVDELY